MTLLSHLHSFSDIKTLLLCLFALDAQERENCLETPPRPGTRCDLDTQICSKGRRKSFSCTTIPSSHSHIHSDKHTHIHTLKHPMVPHPNRELCNVISKKTRLNRSPSRQRTLYCYIEKDKTEPFPIPTENSALLSRKRQD